jgi:dTDP-glucose 4,6-dehydratase
MMKVLVTGGAGFIGSCVVRTLLELHPECKVINLDLLTYAGNLENLADVEDNPRYQFVHGDIRDSNLVASIIKEVDACIHTAAETHVDRSVTTPAIFTETNVLGTQVLLEVARSQGLQKFVMVSTDEVYGSLALDTPEKFTETSLLKPNSPYAASKAAADLLSLSYFKTYDMPICVTRCGNNYGPYQYPEKLIPFFILKILQGNTVPVYGDGLNVRDWVHVADHATAIIKVLINGLPGEVYNVGANTQRNNLEITKTLLNLLGQSESAIAFVPDRPGHDRRYALETSKIESELGWKPSYSFETALAETVTWYKTNSEWIQNIEERQKRDKVTPGAAWLKNASW